MDKKDFQSKVKFVTKFGRALHTVGSPAHTLEATIQNLCQLFGLKSNVVSLPTAIFSSFSDGQEEVTKIDRIEPMDIDLGKLSRVDLVAQEVISGQTSFEEGSSKLDAVLKGPELYGSGIQVACFLFMAGGFMVLFGGTWGDFLAAIAIGALMGLIQHFKPKDARAQLFEALVAIFASFFTYILAKLYAGLNVAIVILSSLIIFMPGLNITIAIGEIATQNLTSGTSRLVGGVMTLLKLTFGVFIGSKLASWFHLSPLELTFSKIPDWVTIMTLPITAMMATVIFKAEREDWIWVTLAGVFGYSCSKVGSYYLGVELGMFFGGACVGAASNVFARSQNRPSSIFQFPGIILLVPGSIGYRSLSSLFQRDVLVGLDTAFTMVSLALALVVGVFVGNMMVKPRSLNSPTAQN